MIYNTFQLGAYIAGLFEGDGHISMPTTKHKHNPRWHITFNKKDLPLANKLLTVIGSGFIRQKKKQNACVLTISNVKSLKFIVNLINDKLRTPKINQLHLLIDWLNKHHDAQIKKLQGCVSCLSTDAWLAGFIDADGSFGLRNTQKTEITKRRISCRFRLEQRMLDKTGFSYQPVLQSIADYLNVKLNTRYQKKTNRTYFSIEVSSFKSVGLLQIYLNKYYLLSSKHLDYNNWNKVAQLIQSNQHYTSKNSTLIQILKQNMNQNRSYFCWTHLNSIKI